MQVFKLWFPVLIRKYCGVRTMTNIEKAWLKALGWAVVGLLSLNVLSWINYVMAAHQLAVSHHHTNFFPYFSQEHIQMTRFQLNFHEYASHSGGVFVNKGHKLTRAINEWRTTGNVYGFCLSTRMSVASLASSNLRCKINLFVLNFFHIS